MARLMNYTQQLFNNIHKLYLSIYTDVEQPIAGAVISKLTKALSCSSLKNQKMRVKLGFS